MTRAGHVQGVSVRRIFSWIFIHALVLRSGLQAQPQSAGVTLNVTNLVASVPFTPVYGVRLAVDRDGIAFLVTEALAMSGGSSVHMILPDGTQFMNFVNAGTVFGQPATHPGDGFVYAAYWQQGATSSTLARLVPGGGALPFATLPMRVEALAIDRNGAFYVAGFNGPQGPGVYKYTNLAAPPVGYAHQANVSSLVACANGMVLASNGLSLSRFVAGGMVPFWTPQPTQPGGLSSILGLTRAPWNQTGLGIAVALNEWIPNWLMFFSQLVHLDPNGVATTAAYLTPGERFAGVAADTDRGIWVLADTGTSPNFVRTLWTAEESSAVGAPASLQSSTLGQVVTFTLDGPVGAPFLLGFMGWFGGLPPGFYAPGYGLVELHPWDPMYAPAIDGLGLFGAPSPFGVLPSSGQAVLPATIPAGLTGSMIAVQGVVPGALAPNSLFYLSQVLLVTLP
jgi:hypothetical protein